MPYYDYVCLKCGPFEVFVPLKDFSKVYWHDCPGYYGSCYSELMVSVPRFEGLENDRGLSYNPMTGERISHGFHNYMVDGPNGDGSFSDRAEYKTWMKKEGLEETGPGYAQALKGQLKNARLPKPKESSG